MLCEIGKYTKGKVGFGFCEYNFVTSVKILLNCRIAFQRCLELEPRCVGALVGMSILELNSKHVSLQQANTGQKIIVYFFFTCIA